MKPDLYLASASDIHCGHKKTTTEWVIKTLRREFPDTVSTHALDLILFGGDFFDQLLHLNQYDVPMILEWAGLFFQMAEQHQIEVYFLEGTPSHDWRQQRLLEVLKVLGHGRNHVHFVDELSIVHNARLGIDILFVPDEWRPEPDDTWMEVRQLLLEKGLEKVDFTVLHGAFDFQLPAHVTVPKHTAERYQNITRHRVFGAHIHTPSVHGNIRVNGSLERLAHNEEEDKGHWRVRFKDGEVDHEKFVVNKHAKIYRTIDCTKTELDEALTLVRKEVQAMPDDSHVRIRANKGEPVLASLDVLRKQFPQIHWSTKAIEVEEIQQNLLVDLRATYSQVQITPENIQELLLNRLEQMAVDPAVLARCHQRIGELG